MRRKQLAVVFCVLLGWPMIVAAVRAQAEALWDDLSLIGYDDRGVQQAKDDTHAQPCQSCPPACACQSYPSEADCPCNTADRAPMSAAAPLIMTIGPPPRLYSPAADFGARVQTGSASWTVVGDENIAAFQHPAVPATLAACAGAQYPAPPMPVACGNYGMLPAGPNIVATYPPTILDAPPQAYAPPVMYTGYTPPAYQPPLPGYFSPAVAAHPISGEADRMDHMLQAIHHLEAAGMQAEADQLRCVCDHQLQQAFNQLKIAEAEETGSRQLGRTQTAIAANLPMQPVVTAAMQSAKKADVEHYAVQQASYSAPAETSTATDRPTDSFDSYVLPAPFVPELITIEPMKVFSEPSECWGVQPTHEPFTASPVKIDCSR